MKCKAKWNKKYQDWTLHCEDCSITMVSARPFSEIYLPEDMAILHVRRYHKE
jgi:hypothetical protein